jgi:hypothetical protein
MTFAIVKVLPLPVMPRSVCPCRRGGSLTALLDGLRLVACRPKGRVQLKVHGFASFFFSEMM